ncbi:legume-like lectin family-domain-containing protein [Umbelopsis sp. PMI_123]|nr:legume-like lectin family-domain-containing protein [Umbelopsis sp. PMI_123]
MKAPIILGIACLSSCMTGSTAYNFFGGSEENSKNTMVKNPQASPFKLDYKLSFKKPYYYNNTVPFWITSGDVIKAADCIRLAPSVPGAKGQIWSTIPNPYPEWEVNLQLRISGQHVGGGRGMAFWYAAQPHQDGPIYGSKDKWVGLGVWFDSHNPKTKSPMTMALVNDGTKEFATRLDPTKHMLGSCFHNYRNTNEPLYVKITYKEKTLSVMMDRENRGASYHHCLRKQNVDLPTGYFFGLSAASQHPADDHDVISLETWQLNPPPKRSHPNRPMEEEKVKKGQKFEGLDEIQRQKIEEISQKVNVLRELAGEKEPTDLAMISMAAVLDQQHRLVEELKMVQLQLQALGAPTVDDITGGKIEDIIWTRPKSSYGTTSDSSSSQFDNSVASSIQIHLDQLIKRSRDQESQVMNLLSAVGRLENGIRSMEVGYVERK